MSAKRKRSSSGGVSVVPVETYEVKGDDVRSPEDTELAERAISEDQLELPHVETSDDLTAEQVTEILRGTFEEKSTSE